MKKIFEQTMLGNLKLKNRMIRSATWEALADESGHMDEELYSVYEGIAAGGIGAIISGFTSVADNDYYFGGMVRLSNDESTERKQNRISFTLPSSDQGIGSAESLAKRRYRTRKVYIL